MRYRTLHQRCRAASGQELTKLLGQIVGEAATLAAQLKPHQLTIQYLLSSTPPFIYQLDVTSMTFASFLSASSLSR